MPNDAEEMAGFHRSQMPLCTFGRYRYRLRQQTRTERPAEPFNDVADGTSRRPNGRKDGEGTYCVYWCYPHPQASSWLVLRWLHYSRAVKRQRVRRLGQQAANLKAVGYLDQHHSSD
ncbi:hypothetical protein CMUS01_14618 [Colletotrichum musicola]|uniref:Uncharacterized protein n=1 Tax=Colletotrichum musicola TaxID=2175873 RepID=A0A8H6MRD0_9PEZI|nr:hypothetical protein CMUS01_14618 [Colletotrichum musicola]